MQESCFSAHRTGRIFLPSDFGVEIRGKLVPTIEAMILLVTEFIFAVPMKVLIVVAFRAFYVYNLLHEASSFQC